MQKLNTNREDAKNAKENGACKLVKQARPNACPLTPAPLYRLGRGLHPPLSSLALRSAFIQRESVAHAFFALLASWRFSSFSDQNRTRSWNSNCRICLALVRRP